MTALVVIALICFLLTVVTWIADRTEPEQPEPFEQSSHVTVKKVAK